MHGTLFLICISHYNMDMLREGIKQGVKAFFKLRLFEYHLLKP
ncbi:hypothetical protein HBZS_104310 [Helicobacter bizzozeronii CCUG 35545]|nr:hypothetical protein HBZS_104310 [Helicobacter bizzozeronii CCUG 35545]